MKKNSYDHDKYMQEKMSAYSANADYSKSMNVYKTFAYVSGALITGIYILSLLM